MKDPLYGNKVAAAVLVVLLLAVGLPVVVNTFADLFAHLGDHHEADAENPFGLVYPTDLEIDTGGGGGAAEPEVPFLVLLNAADPERGARGAAICSSCHSFDKGGPNGTGPNLWDVVGRPVAGVPGYAYSAALESHGGEWTYENLDPYLYNSQGYVPGTQMAQKIRKGEKRADIIAYLGTLSDSPVPIPPAPEVVAEEPTEGETAMDEAGAAAADTIDFEAAQPGEAVISDEDEVNDRGDDGYPGDIAKEGSSYRSSEEDAAPVPDQDDADGLGEDLSEGQGEGQAAEGLPNARAARQSAQPEARPE